MYAVGNFNCLVLECSRYYSVVCSVLILVSDVEENVYINFCRNWRSFVS